MSLRNDIMRFSVLGFRSEKRIELQAPVVSEHKLQAIYVQKHSFSNIYCLRFFFKDKISKFIYLCKIFK